MVNSFRLSSTLSSWIMINIKIFNHNSTDTIIPLWCSRIIWNEEQMFQYNVYVREVQYGREAGQAKHPHHHHHHHHHHHFHLHHLHHHRPLLNHTHHHNPHHDVDCVYRQNTSEALELILIPLVSWSLEPSTRWWQTSWSSWWWWWCGWCWWWWYCSHTLIQKSITCGGSHVYNFGICILLVD